MWPCFEPILRLCCVLPVLYALSTEMKNSIDYIVFMHSKCCFINVAIISAVLLGFIVKMCDVWLKTLIILTPTPKETIIIMGNSKEDSKDSKDPKDPKDPKQDKKSRRNRQRRAHFE